MQLIIFILNPMANMVWKEKKRVNFPSYNSNKFHNSNMFTNSYITIHTIFLHTKEERLKNRDFFSINVNAIAV